MVRRLFASALLSLGTLAAQAAVIQGPAFIRASTTLATCGATCSFVGSDINQIADGDTSNMNGWAGANFAVGTIQLDLLGQFDLTSFSIWNDVNVQREGVGDFQLHFYDAANQLISDSAVFTAPAGQFAAGVYNLGLVQNVSRVDLEVKTLLTGGVCCRIEIREVAFNGSPSAGGNGGTVPEPSGLALTGLGLAGLAAARRAQRR